MVDPQPSSSAAPIRLDGSEIDAALANSEFLTQAEVLSRRSRRLKQLAGIYRDHYWALMEQLKSQHRRYFWVYGKSPYVEADENGPSDLNCSAAAAGGDLGVKGGKSNDESGNICVAQGCRVKAMALTNFCLMHILSDPNQKLYKPCRFPINKTYVNVLSFQNCSCCDDYALSIHGYEFMLLCVIQIVTSLDKTAI